MKNVGCRLLLFSETCSGKFHFYCGMKLCRNLKNYFCCNCDGLQQETLSVLGMSLVLVVKFKVCCFPSACKPRLIFSCQVCPPEIHLGAQTTLSAIGLKRVVGGVAKAYRAARVEPVGYKKCRDQPKKEKGNSKHLLKVRSGRQTG